MNAVFAWNPPASSGAEVAPARSRWALLLLLGLVFAGCDAADEPTQADGAMEALPEVLVVVVEGPQGVLEAGQEVALEARVVTDDPAGLEATWVSDLDGELGVTPLDAEGRATLATTALSPGRHQVSVTVADGARQGDAGLEVAVCHVMANGGFGVDLTTSRWRMFGDARLFEGDRVRLTHRDEDLAGALYNLADPLPAGDLAVSFEIWRSNAGGEGAALSVIAAADPDALVEVVEAGLVGPATGLGYGVAGAYGEATTRAFHLEFDTRRTEEPHADPEDDQMAVTLDGDPGVQRLEARLPRSRRAWARVDLVITGSRVQVSVDDELVIDGEIEGFEFAGGYLGFSATTSSTFNDDEVRVGAVSLPEACAVPEALPAEPPAFCPPNDCRAADDAPICAGTAVGHCMLDAEGCFVAVADEQCAARCEGGACCGHLGGACCADGGCGENLACEDGTCVLAPPPYQWIATGSDVVDFELGAGCRSGNGSGTWCDRGTEGRMLYIADAAVVDGRDVLLTFGSEEVLGDEAVPVTDPGGRGSGVRFAPTLRTGRLRHEAMVSGAGNCDSVTVAPLEATVYTCMAVEP